jgi:hypothetical protein
MRLTECTVRGDGASLLIERCAIIPYICASARMYFASHDRLGDHRHLRGTVRAKRARAAGLPQRLKRCVAIWCDAQRRVAERYDAPRRVALPTVMSISPTRLIDDPNMVRSRGDFKTALLP